MPDQSLTAASVSPLRGRIKIPGDKSISHRALILGALAAGETTARGLLDSEDVMATAAALRALGAVIERDDAGLWHIAGRGVGGLRQPAEPLDFGNSGTGARLMMGVLATHPLTSRFTGDASLSSRPMRRVLVPLERMGAIAECTEGGRLPLTLHGSAEPVPISYELPVASAQVKSAILLAALNTPGCTTVIEPVATRDHSERMLALFGAEIKTRPLAGGGREISLVGEAELQPQHIDVPGDPSSAAFAVVAAILVPGSDIIVENVMMNPARDGLYKTLAEMGANIEMFNHRSQSGEEVVDMRVRSGRLKGVAVPASRAASMIDEYPVLAIAAAFADGETRMEGLAELRVKESDRLSAVQNGLAACGGLCEAGDDYLIVKGQGEIAGGAVVKTSFDHRIAMAFLVMGLASRAPVSVDDAAAIATSFPDFLELMQKLGADISPRAKKRRMLIAIDGPAAAGKGTLARALARHYGLEYLDTGSLYRAVAVTLLNRGIEPQNANAAADAARNLDLAAIEEKSLRSVEAGDAASIVAQNPQVRAALLDFQRRFAAGNNGAVLDGRDIGTVVVPDADVKLFITASPIERARRRWAELKAGGEEVEEAQILAQIKARDARDTARAAAPLKKDAEAHLLNTTKLDIEAAFQMAVSIIDGETGGGIS